MQRVDFYMIPANDNQARLQFACKLTEKAWSMSHSVYIFAKNTTEASILDEMLWNYSAESFLPHGLKNTENANEHPILIGDDANAGKAFDLFINLTDHMPLQVEQNQRVAEILHQNPECLDPGRARYKEYKRLCQQSGSEINYHELGQH